MEALRSMGQQTLQVGCQYPENGKPCGRPLSGTAWMYCDLHREAGQKEAKRQRDKEDKADYRERNHLEDNYYHFLYYHGLTKRQLEPLFDHSETIQEEYSCPDDFHQSILIELNKINSRMLNPPAYLLSIAKDAKSQILGVVNKLKRQQDVYSYSNSTTDRLTACALELRRDIGKKVSQRAFTEISGEAKDVLEIWRNHKDIRGFIYALFVNVELNRLKFLAMPHERGFLNGAHRWLTAAADACDQFLNHYASTHKQTASLLAFCVPLLKTALAFNGNEPDKAEGSLQSLEYIANTVADSYGTTSVTENIRFSCLIHQSQFYMYFNGIDRAYQYLNEAEKILSTSTWSSIESQLEVAYVRAGLGLASNHQDRYKDLQEYILLFQHHPFLTQYRYLQALKQLYPNDIDASLFEGIPIYFDTMFRRLQPFLFKV